MLLAPNSGPFLLDHCTIESSLNIPINPRTLPKISQCNFKDIDMEKFCCEVKLDLNTLLWKIAI